MDKLYLEVITRAGERFDDKFNIDVYEYPLKNYKISKEAKEDIAQKLDKLSFAVASEYFSNNNGFDQFDMVIGQYRKIVGSRFTFQKRTEDEIAEDFHEAICKAIEQQNCEIESLNRSLYVEYEKKALLNEMLIAEPFNK